MKKTLATKRPTLTFTIYTDRRHEYRWRAVHRNGRIVACSGEGYKRRSTCHRSLHRFLSTVAAWDLTF